MCREVSGWCLKLHCCTPGLLRTSAGSTPCKGTTSPIPIQPFIIIIIIIIILLSGAQDESVAAGSRVAAG